MPFQTLTSDQTLAGQGSATSLAGCGLPAAGEALAPGALVNGRYRVDSAIGRGGMGVVYAVEDLLHDRRVALKTVAGRHVAAQQLELFKVEFRIMAGLRHPHVAAVYDFEPLHRTADYFYTMELVEGRGLLSATEGAPLERVVELGVQLLRALAYLHSRKIVHGDVKPGNVLVDAQGQVRVLDFGIAGVGQGRGQMGTPAYMAPEVFAPDAVVDHRADLYSAGIVLYQLVHRKVPFHADSPVSMQRLHQEAPLDITADERCPAWLARVIARLCQKDPSERYRFANEAIADLNRLAGMSHPLETAATAESYVVSSRFTGRDAELGRAIDHVMASVAGDAGAAPALFIGGPGGIGKSRLMREVKQRAQLARLPFVESSCYEGAFAELAPIIAMLRHTVGLARLARAEALVDSYAEALRRADPSLGDGGAPPRTPSAEADGDERRALLDRLAGFLIEVAARMPYVLHLDDAQWAGRATVDVLLNVVRRQAQAHAAGRRTRLALLVSYRDDEIAGRPAADLLADGRTAGAASVELGPLGQEDIRRLLCSMLGVDALPDAFVERVAGETAGNTFFVEEVMRSLVDRGDVYLEAGAWAARAAIGELEIPATVAGVFRRRAGLLDPPARALLELVAVVGRPGSGELLAACAGRSLGETYLLLRDLVERRMVVRAGSEQITHAIGHDRMRETLVRDLAPEVRRGIHLAIARTLETRPEGEASVHEVAYHYVRAEDRPRALRASLAAGDQAREAYACELAHQHFTNALGLLEDGDPRARELEETLADLESLIGRYAEALVRYGALLDAGAPEIRARLLRKLAQLHVHVGDPALALEPVREAIGLLGGRLPSSIAGQAVALVGVGAKHLAQRLAGRAPAVGAAHRARLGELSAAYRQLGYAHYFMGSPTRYVLPMLLARNAGEGSGESKGLCRTTAEVGFMYHQIGLRRPGARLCDEAVAMGERLSAHVELGVALSLRATCWLQDGNPREAIRASRRARDLLLEHGDLLLLTTAEVSLGKALQTTGAVRAAAESAAQVVEVVERSGSHAYVKYVRASLGMYLGLLGDRAGAAAHLERARRQAEADRDIVVLLSALASRGHVELVRGDPAAAVASLTEARALRPERTVGRAWLVGYILPTLVRARLEVERAGGARAPRRDQARAIAEALAHTRRRVQFLPWALLAEAAWSWHLGRRRRARRSFEACLAACEAQADMSVRAEARLELGRARLVSGEAPEGRRLLAQAAEDFVRMEISPRRELVRRLLAE